MYIMSKNNIKWDEINKKSINKRFIIITFDWIKTGLFG
jgi:hypothetical protein